MTRYKYLWHIPLIVLATAAMLPPAFCLGAEPKQVQLSAIATTSGQRELKQLRAAFGAEKPSKDEDYEAALGRVVGPVHSIGASNVFLIDAPSLPQAMNATVNVLQGGWSADLVATLNMPNAPRGNYWLVVYLGVAGSSPPHWLVDGVSIEGNRIRFRYHKNGTGSETKDVHSYYYWVPLGALDSGIYKLELFETGFKDASLSRRVAVKIPRQ